MRLRMLRALTLVAGFIGFVALAPPVRAEDGEIRLDVDLEQVGLDDTFVATVSATGDASGAGEPHLEVGQAFRIVSTGRSQSISFINGRTSVEVRWQYTLQPMREGIFEVGPALLRVGGRELRSRRVGVRVVAGSVAPPPSQAMDPWSRIFGGPPAGRRRPVQAGKVRLVGQLDKQEAYPGEQVNYTLRLLTQLDVRTVKPRSDPQLTGFWSETMEVPNPPQPERVSFEGENYTSYLLRRIALFPTSPGRIEVSSAIWDLAVVIPDGFFGEVQEISRSTEPLALEVLPLPAAGRPDGFAGAVGEFEIKVTADKSAVTVGEAVALKVTVSGTGNLKTIPAPTLPEIPDSRSYASTSSQSIQMKGGRMSGSRTWEFVVVPNAPGDRVIPPLRYPFFQPSKRAWRVAESEALALAVAKGSGGEVVPVAGAGSAPAPAGTRKAVEPVRRDVAHLKLEAPGLGRRDPALHESRLARFALALPVLLNVGALLYQWGRRRELSDPAAVRRRGARRSAERKLDAVTAALAGKSLDGVAARIAESVVGYVADRIDEPAGGLTRDRLAEVVGARAGAERSRDLLALLDRCDYFAFTPAAGSPAEAGKLAAQARALLGQLERGFAREGRS